MHHPMKLHLHEIYELVVIFGETDDNDSSSSWFWLVGFAIKTTEHD